MNTDVILLSRGDVCRVGQNHIYIRCTHDIFAREQTNIRPYTVYLCGSGQPHLCYGLANGKN